MGFLSAQRPRASNFSPDPSQRSGGLSLGAAAWGIFGAWRATRIRPRPSAGGFFLGPLTLAAQMEHPPPVVAVVSPNSRTLSRLMSLLSPLRPPSTSPYAYGLLYVSYCSDLSNSLNVPEIHTPRYLSTPPSVTIRVSPSPGTDCASRWAEVSVSGTMYCS